MTELPRSLKPTDDKDEKKTKKTETQGSKPIKPQPVPPSTPMSEHIRLLGEIVNANPDLTDEEKMRLDSIIARQFESRKRLNDFFNVCMAMYVIDERRKGDSWVGISWDDLYLLHLEEMRQFWDLRDAKSKLDCIMNMVNYLAQAGSQLYAIINKVDKSGTPMVRTSQPFMDRLVYAIRSQRPPVAQAPTESEQGKQERQVPDAEPRNAAGSPKEEKKNGG